MTRSTIQRLEVWRGDRKRTSGGLRKSDLTKNARGKIVSKKKSEQASKQNNLGDKLRKKGALAAHCCRSARCRYFRKRLRRV